MRFLIPVAIVFIILGCANMNSVYRKFNVDDGKGALIDIKQRAIFVSKSKDSTNKPIICAEPSPDALSAYAAEFAANADVPQAGFGVGIASAFQEGASFIGMRTQSIQLLRDGFYRLCEGYMSGALSDIQYELLMRRYQKYTVVLLGIEQLAGVVRTPVVAINTQGLANTAITNIPDHDRATISGLTNTLIINTTATDKDISKIAETIKELVLEVINLDDTAPLCFEYLYNNPNVNTPISNICTKYFDLIINSPRAGITNAPPTGIFKGGF